MIKHLAGKTVFISGGSRGIGLAIGLRCAQDGANIIIAAKTAEPNPKLPGTIYTAAKEIEQAGGNCLPAIVDIRYEDQVARAIEDGVKKFGGIDIVINNASAISLTNTLDTTMKKYDLMNTVNARGTFLCSKLAIPYLKKSKNPHILTLSPPLNLNPKWFKDNVAYTIAKYGMSMCVLGMSEEFKEDGIAVNALWPRTAIQTAAIDFIAGDVSNQCRKADIMADAAYQILIKNSRQFTGQFVIDEHILREDAGITNFDKYAVAPGHELLLDLFLDENEYKNAKLLETKKDTTDVKGKTESVDINATMNSLSKILSADLVREIKGVYAFNFSDVTPSEWYLDLKNGAGSVGSGEPKEGKANCTMKMSAKVFVDMFSGVLKPTTAFMSGKLKISGDLGLAMKLEKIMSNMKSKL